MIDVLTPHDINNATNSILSLGREIIPQEIIKLTVPEWAEKNRIITLTAGPECNSFRDSEKGNRLKSGMVAPL